MTDHSYAQVVYCTYNPNYMSKTMKSRNKRTSLEWLEVWMAYGYGVVTTVSEAANSRMATALSSSAPARRHFKL